MESKSLKLLTFEKSVHDKTLERLEQAIDLKKSDPEAAQSKAEEAITDFLKQKGMALLAEKFKEATGFYP